MRQKCWQYLRLEQIKLIDVPQFLMLIYRFFINNKTDNCSLNSKRSVLKLAKLMNKIYFVKCIRKYFFISNRLNLL